MNLAYFPWTSQLSTGKIWLLIGNMLDSLPGRCRPIEGFFFCVCWTAVVCQRTLLYEKPFDILTKEKEPYRDASAIQPTLPHHQWEKKMNLPMVSPPHLFTIWKKWEKENGRKAVDHSYDVALSVPHSCNGTQGKRWERKGGTIVHVVSCGIPLEFL